MRDYIDTVFYDDGLEPIINSITIYIENNGEMYFRCGRHKSYDPVQSHISLLPDHLMDHMSDFCAVCKEDDVHVDGVCEECGGRVHEHCGTIVEDNEGEEKFRCDDC
jgi:hypothetical protein